MNIPSLRNLTTGIMHTEMKDIYVEIKPMSDADKVAMYCRYNKLHNPLGDRSSGVLG